MEPELCIYVLKQLVRRAPVDSPRPGYGGLRTHEALTSRYRCPGILLTQDRFNLTATSGLLLPDQRVNVMVEFMPLDGRLSSMRLTLRIGTGTQNLKVGRRASRRLS